MASQILNWTPDLAHLSTTFGLLGAAFHISIIPFEIDNQTGTLLIVYAFTWAGLAASFSKGYGLSWIAALGAASQAGFWFFAGLTASLVLYRLFFHRLRRFPGPWGAKLSRFHTVGLVTKSNIKFHLELEKLHQKYGDFVRTGPRELSIVNPFAVQPIHGPGSHCPKSPFYHQLTDDDTKNSLNWTRDPELHRLRRRVWDRSLGPKALASYEPRLQTKLDFLIKQIHARTNENFDITKWTIFYSFDVMGEIAFSQDFHQMDTATEHYAISAIHAQMEQLGIFGAVPWLVHLLTLIPGLNGPYEKYAQYCSEKISERRAKWDSESDKTPTDVISWLLKSVDEKDRSAPPGDQALEEEGRLVVAAGSDTVATTLANAIFLLASHPAVYKRLQDEVDQAAKNPETFNNDMIPQIPYIEGIIKETLRLKPVAPSGISRVTPPEGLLIDGTHVPGNTIVVVPQHIMHRDERCYVRPLEFLPERWLDEGKHLLVDDQAYFPFMLGPYACIGKQMALVQMRGVFRRIALEFDVSLAPGEDGIAFDTEFKDTFTVSLPPLQLMFTERKIEN